MRLPSPPALRLVSRAPLSAKPRAPFGLDGWSEEAPAMAVVLDSTAAPCDQIPESSTLADATLLVILGEGPPSSSLLARVFRQSGRAIPRAVRATALLARGFVGIGAGVDPASGMDLVWGYAAQARAD